MRSEFPLRAPKKPPFPLMGKGRGWGDLLSRRRRAASTAEITPPLPLPIEGRGHASGVPA
ncbi:hypothetical protein CA606_00275 [Caulobacter vibrioides]|uniref:Uncharacterized protein n=1 Tax=Caulobacter vibrioides TaxID=155892 RepID=A0A290MFQ0_CAUVI|nr:hypothetical protein [Caulobacter vibrioides]ATC30904.1 hypothetical protein CA606_00275 [Caulobacter vibrioides]